MECKCRYYHRNEKGILVCVVCGKPSPRESVPEDKAPIEDKIQEIAEDKIAEKHDLKIWPLESRRIKTTVTNQNRPKTKGRK